jgi:predicted small metal-binding protein
MNVRRISAALGLLCAALAQGSSIAAQPRPEEPETVMITFHAKAGAEAELAQVIARHWQTARRLKMIRETPHLTLRSAEGAQTDFVEIMTWRDASVPDAAPPEIQKIWAEMNRLVEKRGTAPGLNIEQMSVVTETP